MNALMDKTRDELAEVKAQLREEQRLHVVTLDERDEAREQRDRLAKECEWMRALIATIRDKAELQFNGNRGLLAFSDLKDAALATLNQTTK